MSEPKKLTKLITDAVDRSADAAEEIHKAVVNLPLDVIERTLQVGEGVGDLRRAQERTIGAVYDLVRGINREVGKLAGEIAEAGGLRRLRAGRPARAKPRAETEPKAA